LYVAHARRSGYHARIYWGCVERALGPRTGACTPPPETLAPLDPLGPWGPLGVIKVEYWSCKAGAVGVLQSQDAAYRGRGCWCRHDNNSVMMRMNGADVTGLRCRPRPRSNQLWRTLTPLTAWRSTLRLVFILLSSRPQKPQTARRSRCRCACAGVRSSRPPSVHGLRLLARSAERIQGSRLDKASQQTKLELHFIVKLVVGLDRCLEGVV